MKQWIKSRPVEALIIVVLTLALLFGGGTRPAPMVPAAAIEQLDSARAFGNAALARADSLERAVYKRDSQLAVARAARNVERARADSIEDVFEETLEGFLTMETPDTCAAVRAEAETLLSQAVNIIEHLRLGAYQDSVIISTADAMIGDLLAQHILMRDALERYDVTAHAVTTAISAAKPKWYTRLRPTIGVGLAAGFGEDNRPHTVVGLTVGWRLR